ERGQCQGLVGSVRLESRVVEDDHGEADAVHRDALARDDAGRGEAAETDAQARVAAAHLAREQRTDALDQTGEHQRLGRSSTRTSSPTRRVSTMSIAK